MTIMKDEAASPLSPRQLLTPAEVARMLGITVSTLAVWRCRRRYALRYVKVGRRVLYRPEAVLEFVQRREVGAEEVV